jgi:hypothetical protein
MSKETDNFKQGQEALICNFYTFGNTVYDIYGLFNTLIIIWPVWIHSNMVTRFQMSDLWPNSRYYSTELMSQNDRIITTWKCPLKTIKMCQDCWEFGLCPSYGILKTWKNTMFHIFPVITFWRSLIPGVCIAVITSIMTLVFQRLKLVPSNGPNRVGVSNPSPEDGNG